MNEVRSLTRAQRVLADERVVSISPGSSDFSAWIALLELEPPSQPCRKLAVKWCCLIGLDGMSYHEAADVLGVPIGTIRSRLTPARATLRNASVAGISKPVSTERGAQGQHVAA